MRVAVVKVAVLVGGLGLPLGMAAAQSAVRPAGGAEAGPVTGGGAGTQRAATTAKGDGVAQKAGGPGEAGQQAASRAALEAANAAEHQRELGLLGLKATRPGVGHNNTEPNPANYEESRAVVTDQNILQPGTLPAVLQFADGRPVRTAADWQRRRAELMRLFDEVELGVTPAKTPAVTWRLVSTTQETRFGKPVKVKVLRGGLEHTTDGKPVSIDLTVVTPVSAPQGRVPVVLEFHWTYPPEVLVRVKPDPGVPWQQQVLERGWGYVEYSPFTLQPDSAEGLTSGVIGMVNHGKPRSLQDWGTLKAWSWGASRALDYLETDADVDAKRVAIEGHSRLGKAALVAMAYEPRFAVAFLSSSGAGGAGLWRRNVGEQLENVEAPHEFHWMGGNLLKYAADPLHAADLPLDQHELIALCAPRPVFVSGGGEGDKWLDPHGMFLASVAASPVWELLGSRGLRDRDGLVTSFPAAETPLVAGDLAFRQHTGGHIPGPNWPTFLDFAARYIGAPTARPK